VQAWKIIVPASNSEPAPKSHEGHEWLYVLAGRMRLASATTATCSKSARQCGVQHSSAALARAHRRPCR
jgi:hypothetical protein